MAEQLAVLGDDPDVEVVDQQQHAHAGVDPADGDLVPVASIAQRDAARLVDAVLADPVVALGGDRRLLGRGLGPGGEGLRRRASSDGPVGRTVS